MSAHFYVDPEDLRGQAKPYHHAAKTFARLRQRIVDMETTYGGAYGSDDLGEKFTPQFRYVMGYLSDGVDGMEEALTYNAEGLLDVGETFAVAEDEGVQLGYRLGEEIPQVGPGGNGDGPREYRRAYAVEGRKLLPGEQAPVLHSKVVRARIAEEGEVLEPRVWRAVAPMDETDGERPTFFRSAKLGVEPGTLPQGERIEGQQPLAFARAERLLVGEPVIARSEQDAQPGQPYFVDVDNPIFVPQPGAVVDPSIPEDDFGPWYVNPDGTVTPHPMIAVKPVVDAPPRG
ncbi:hypothetical protein [Actinoplanes sp. NPDC051859]|uniref:hypothetical protein n=1 Tax=Actinoplanes sp. NPDC051859 TaxID=3363909 RepID=UPI003796ACC3